MKVWKYDLHHYGPNDLQMPAGAIPIHADVQAGQPCLWALVDPARPPEPRRFLLAATGQELGETVGRHVGSYLQLDGIFVYHVFEVTP